jgi:gluconolactonase
MRRGGAIIVRKHRTRIGLSRCAAILPLAILALTAFDGGRAAAEAGFRIVRLDLRLDAILAPNTRVEKIADGFTWVEGPLWDARDGSLLFSDIPANSVLRWKAGLGARLFLRPSGYSGAESFAGMEPGSNGLAFDKQGRLVLAEHGDRRIARLERDGTKTTLAGRYQGRRLNSPNDLVFRSDGSLYFTDPPFGLPQAFDDPAKELPFQGVYRLAQDGELTLLTREFGAPNGVAFSPDERTLYLTDVHPDRAAWYAYDVRDDGTIANGRIFHDAAPWKRPPYFGPDGLKVDRAGNVFGARPGGLNIFAPDGTLVGRIEIGLPVSNCAWGDDGRTLYITGGSALYRLRVLIGSAPAAVSYGAAHHLK